MGMFTNYQQELVKVYQPNNLVNAFPTPITDSKLKSLPEGKPYEEYDAKGNLIGYCWKQGETLNLEFNIEGELTVEDNALVSFIKGETPENLSVDSESRRYYNVFDMKSWTAFRDGDDVTWVEDQEFTYPESDSEFTLKRIFIPAENYLEDKQVVVTLFNFRMEPIHTWNSGVTRSKVVCPIDKELSRTLVRGIYYCSAVVENESVRFNIFDTTDCVLHVK